MTNNFIKKKCSRCGHGAAEYCERCYQIARAQTIIFENKTEERNYKWSKEYNLERRV